MNGPIFIHGILQRSGTNLLNQIILLHPDCVQPILKIRENWFLHYSDLVWDYADSLFSYWSSPEWGGDEFSKSDFFSTIGDALQLYLFNGITDVTNRVLITKTPSVQHLERSFKLFPYSKVIILVRDPRDIAASALKTWGRPIAYTINDWELASQSIAEFEKIAPPESYLLIRYEDLVSQSTQFARICIKFLNLDESVFPWWDLKELPVLGSSEFHTWQAQKASPSFKPVGRWRSLPKDQKNILKYASIKNLSYFGYSTSSDDGLSPLPTREERLQYRFRPIDNILTARQVESTPRKRVAALRKSLRFLAEAVLGEKAANFVRRRCRIAVK